MSPSQKASETIVSCFTLTSIGVALTFIPTLVWYGFDDTLAELTGVPALGDLPFWSVYAFCWFVSLAGIRARQPADKPKGTTP